MPDFLSTDQYTIPLVLLLAVVALVGTYLKPYSLVHPILLGRQSDVERVRRKGESVVYRNYGTGMMGRLPTRPSKEVLLLKDLIKPDFNEARNLWSTSISNSDLLAKVNALSNSLVTEAGLTPGESNVLLLLNDGLEFIITDLALSQLSVPSFTISSPDLLSKVLERHPPDAVVMHASFLSRFLELVLDNNEYHNHTYIIVGENDFSVSHESIRVLHWDHLSNHTLTRGPIEYPNIDPDTAFTLAFHKTPAGDLKATQLSHVNLTAGVTATRMLLPLNEPVSPSDSIVSAHSLSTPYGRAVAYAALFDGAHFATTPSTNMFFGSETTMSAVQNISELKKAPISSLPSPTLAFITPTHLRSMVFSVMANAQKSFLFNFALLHKTAALREGFVGKDTFWDKLAFTDARKAALGDLSTSLRGVIVSAGLLEEAELTPARIALSIPFVHAHTNPLIAGPVFATHPFDLQAFPPSLSGKVQGSAVAHVGPPSVVLEVKLDGVDDVAVEAGNDPVGQVLVRGPSVGQPLGKQELPDHWVRISERALTQPNGTFKILLE